ncbi:hypothetical protein [Kitasatospora brasiliensis]|uniref:hypothetical protein n=1 Tax=Kitasatospora brasiliensis TaxID=3058040 RepID=UPI00292FA65E|nr:hypothetical protein [Kitasatospora sp. K002]
MHVEQHAPKLQLPYVRVVRRIAAAVFEAPERFNRFIQHWLPARIDWEKILDGVGDELLLVGNEVEVVTLERTELETCRARRAPGLDVGKGGLRIALSSARPTAGLLTAWVLRGLSVSTKR